MPDIGLSTQTETLDSPAIVQPGAMYEDTVSLASWFEFKDARNHQIHGACFLKFLKPEGRMSDTIWTEYVSGDFAFRIKQ